MATLCVRHLHRLPRECPGLTLDDIALLALVEEDSPRLF